MRHPHGLLGWVDLMTPDVDASRAFYSELFGWTSVDMPTPMGPDYTQFFKDGKLVCGMGPLPPDAGDMPSVWSSYVIVADLDSTLAAVTAAGGQVVMPAIDVMTQGRMAIALDPSGATIGMWQPIEHEGAEVFNIPGALTWNELQTRDLDAAKPFYEDVFGWRWEESPAGGGGYWIAQVDAKAGDDKSNGGAMAVPPGVPEGMPSMWLVYFAVEDCDDAVARALALGATTAFAPMEMGPLRFAGLVDPSGAIFLVGSFLA